MAEHARHSLARAGILVRPWAIQTLAQLLDEWAPQGEAPKALLHLLISQALDRLRPERFRAVAEFPGFVRALADLFEEIPGAGALSGDLARLFVEVERELGARSLGFRNARLFGAAERFRPAGRVVFDGFFTLSDAEVALVLALAERTEVTVTLPDWPGAERARQALLAAGSVVLKRGAVHKAQRSDWSVFSAATIEREVEEIARRILEYTTRGRLFREIAIVLRTRHAYAPLVETTLARFGILARLYFADPVGSHPAVLYLASLVSAMLAGWDHTAVLAALRMPVSGVGATPSGDQLDFVRRE